jgi:hypothetical protein
VRLTETHGKDLSLPCVSKRRTSKTNVRLLQRVEEEKKLFAVRLYLKRMAKILCRAP